VPAHQSSVGYRARFCGDVKSNRLVNVPLLLSVSVTDEALCDVSDIHHSKGCFYFSCFCLPLGLVTLDVVSSALPYFVVGEDMLSGYRTIGRAGTCFRFANS
jgi:hypothetical protein